MLRWIEYKQTADDDENYDDGVDVVDYDVDDDVPIWWN